MEGRGRRSPERPVLRIPPQRGDLVTLCLDVQAPARLLQVGRDGRNRVAPRPARPLPAPAGRRSHWLRRHPAQPASSETAADARMSTRSGRRTTPSSTTSSGFTSRTSLPKTGSNVCALSCKRSATMHLSSPASRRSTKDAVSWRTGWRPRRLDRGPMISFGRATLSSSSTSSAPWCNPTSIDSRVHPPGSSRSARPRASRCVECGRRLRTSPRSTSTRSHEESRTLCAHESGRGSPASTTAGVGS